MVKIRNVCIARLQVLQYGSCLDVSGSFWMLVPSINKYTSDITFHTSSVNVNGAAVPARNYITIVATTDAKDYLTLDGTLIS